MKKLNGHFEKPKRDTEVDRLAKAVNFLTPAQIYHKTWLSRGTIHRLTRRQTRYPSHMTLKGIAAAAGLEYRLVKKD